VCITTRWEHLVLKARELHQKQISRSQQEYLCAPRSRPAPLAWWTSRAANACHYHCDTGVSLVPRTAQEAGWIQKEHSTNERATFVPRWLIGRTGADDRRPLGLHLSFMVRLGRFPRRGRGSSCPPRAGRARGGPPRRGRVMALLVHQYAVVRRMLFWCNSHCPDSRHVRAIPWPSGRWRARRRIDTG